MGVPKGLNIRMGIATGFCTVGNFGSDQRLDYTVLGSPVNLSARLQGLAPTNEILIDEATNNLVNKKVKTKYFDEITPKGFSRPVNIYKVKDFTSKTHKSKRKSFSHKGNHLEINIFDTSNIRAAIMELKKVEIEFNKLLKK